MASNARHIHLTQKQERFAQLVAKGSSKKAAYLEAYPSSQSWKGDKAKDKASELSKQPKVAARIAQLQDRAAERAVISRAEVINMQASLMMKAAKECSEADTLNGASVAAKAAAASSEFLMKWLPEDKPDAGAARSFDFAALLGRAFVDMHRDIMQHRHSEYVLPGGRGSLKTSTVALEIVAAIANDPEANAVIMRNRANTLRDSVYNEVRRAADRLGISDEFLWRLAPLSAIHKNGNGIYFMGADAANPADSKVKGFAPKSGYVRFLWLEEASQFPGYAYVRAIKQTVLRGTGKPVATFLTYNPPLSLSSWVNKEERTPQPGRIVVPSCYTEAPPEWLGEEFLAGAAALKERNERAYMHEYMGEAVGTGANVIDPAIIEVRPITDDERKSIGEVSHGVDAGTVHPWVHERVGFDRESGTLYVLDEDFRTGSAAHDTKTAPLLLERLQDSGEEEADIWCDSAAAGMIRYYGDYGLNARKCFKQGLNAPRERVRWMNRLRRIVIDPATAPLAAEQFPAYEYVTTPGGEVTESLPGINDDAIDAVGYACGLWIREG